MATLLEPTYGDVTLLGRSLPDCAGEVRARIGYMPDEPPIDEELKVWEYLDLFGAAYGLDRRERRERIDELLESFQLAKKREAFCGTLSRGMQQRLILAKTLLPDPELLLLDEPAAGLDPMARIQLRRLLRDLAGRGKTILISSHILTELSGFCTAIGILEAGRMRVSGPVDAIAGDLTPAISLVIRCLDDPETVAAWLREYPRVIRADRQNDRIFCEFSGSESETAELLRALVNRPFRITSFHAEKPDVEEIFLRLGTHEVQ